MKQVVVNWEMVAVVAEEAEVEVVVVMAGGRTGRWPHRAHRYCRSREECRSDRWKWNGSFPVRPD